MKNILLLCIITCSTLWIIGSIIAVSYTWENFSSSTLKNYNIQKLKCKTLYYEKAARERCITIMDLEHFQTKSIGVFNRVLIITSFPSISLLSFYFFNKKGKTIKRRIGKK
jgi:hypothetical protein